jgi:general stress protein 26
MAVAKVEEDSGLWFFTGNDTAKTHEIETDTHVHIVCQNDRSSYLSLSGRASLITDKAKIAELWQEPYRTWFPGGKDDLNIALIAVTPLEGEYWDNGGANKWKYLFETVKAYATHTTPHIEEGEQHGRVSL